MDLNGDNEDSGVEHGDLFEYVVVDNKEVKGADESSNDLFERADGDDSPNDLFEKAGDDDESPNDLFEVDNDLFETSEKVSGSSETPYDLDGGEENEPSAFVVGASENNKEVVRQYVEKLLKEIRSSK